MNRAILYEQLHYTERHIAAGEEAIEKQRQGIAHIEARGDAVTLAPARALLAQMERAQALHVADRNRICELLADSDRAGHLKATRAPPSGPLGIRGHIYQCCDQPQQCLLLWPISTAQKLTEFDVKQSRPGWRIGLVNDESPAAGRLAAEKPGIAVWAAIEFPPLGHGASFFLSI